MSWVLRHGEAFASDLTRLRKSWKRSTSDPNEFHSICRKHHRPVQLAEWPLAKLLLYAPAILQRPLVDFVYRLPTLVLLQATFLCFSAQGTFFWIGMVLILASLWLETLHILANRLILGHLDQAFGRTAGVRLWPYAKIQSEELFPRRSRVVRRFVTLFGWLLLMTLIGYTAIYFSLVRTGIGAFVGIRSDWSGVTDAFYFSVITLATVGYGDVYPGIESTITRLIVASEVMVGFVLIIILLASFTLTIDEPSDE